jgi:2'-5' RNA ligase
VRPVPVELWHITVAFLGDVPEAQVADARQAVLVAAAGADPCQIRVDGGGHFGRGRSTTVWAGIAGDLRGLAALSDEVRTALRNAGVEYDQRPFQPHLTLARPGDRMSPTRIADDIQALGSYHGPSWTVRDLCLMRSQLEPIHRYETVYRAPLAAANGVR